MINEHASEQAGRRSRSFVWRAVAGAAILLGILATQRIDWKSLWETLRRVDLSLLAASLGGFLALMAAKSWRWNFLIRQAGLCYGFGPAFRSYLAAFALGIFTPGRIGELARAAQLRSELGASLGPCVRSVLSDRFFDLVFLGAFGPFALWAVMADRTHDALLVAGFAGFYVAACLVLASMGKFVSKRVRRLSMADSSSTPDPESRTRSGIHFLDTLSRWRPLRFVVDCLVNVSGDLVGRTGFIGSAITLLSYGIYFGASWILFRALGIGLSFRDVACITGCLSLILLLPISIAGIGPREATLIFFLGEYDVSREDALAYSMLQFAVFTLFGGVTGALAVAAGGGHRGGRTATRPSHVPLPTVDGEYHLNAEKSRRNDRVQRHES